MMLSPPSFILLKSSHPKKLPFIIVADEENKATLIKKYERYEYLKALNDIKAFTSFRKQIKGHYAPMIASKQLENLQLLAMSKRSIIDIEIKSKPSNIKEYGDVIAPTYMHTYLENFNITTNIKLDKHLSKVYYDTDWKATEALAYLYNKNKDVYVLDDVLATGSIGMKVNRRPIPTKHAITAVDDILAKTIHEEIKHFPSEKDIKLHIHSSYHNIFYILVLPGPWSFELNEIFSTSSKAWRDYELLKPRQSYAENTTGGYYAVRLPLLEYCKRHQVQQSFVVFRIITPKYYKSVGVWMLREAVRDALSKQPLKFPNIKEALKYISYASANKLNHAINTSVLLKQIKEQKTLLDFKTHP